MEVEGAPSRRKPKRVKMDVTVDPELFKLIEEQRGREKRSTFVEHLIRLGLDAYKRESLNRGQIVQKEGFQR
ncbi:MAG: hypothetical protein QXU45_08845 [Candidatus Bathyarchaeia archaeon]